jgi:hypothetical protein
MISYIRFWIWIEFITLVFTKLNLSISLLRWWWWVVDLEEEDHVKDRMVSSSPDLFSVCGWMVANVFVCVALTKVVPFDEVKAATTCTVRPYDQPYRWLLKSHEILMVNLPIIVLTDFLQIFIKWLDFLPEMRDTWNSHENTRSLCFWYNNVS